MSALQAAHQQGEDLVENLAGTLGLVVPGRMSTLSSDG